MEGLDATITALIGAGGVGGVLVLARAWRAYRGGAITDNRSLIADYERDAEQARTRAQRCERESAQWRTQAHRYRVQLLTAAVEPKDDPIMEKDLT